MNSQSIVAKQGSSAVNRHLSVSEHGGETVFLHRVEEGAASRSYGLHVARLAGVPSSVVERAQVLLQTFEHPAHELPLFSSSPPSSDITEKKESAAETKLREIEPDNLSPREAQEMLYELKSLLDKQ